MSSSTRGRPLLGTYVSVCASAPTAVLNACIDAAFDAVEKVHVRMSFHDAGSELTAINRAAHRASVRCSESLASVCRAALLLARLSEGAFDPTVGRLMVKRGQVPAPDAPDAVDANASWRDVTLDGHNRIRFRRPLWLDLGGIAKGFAVDRAILAMKRAGAVSGIVNAGGDLSCFGSPSTTVGIRSATEPGRIAGTIELREAALATSAGYFSEVILEGRRVTALADPRNRRVLGLDQSVSIVARKAIWADALTKVAFAAPEVLTTLLPRFQARRVELPA